MAGIKISDLPPNTLPLVGDEKMELEDADGNSTRATIDDIASTAPGLDASFITVDPNAALSNERVLTAGTNISLVDTGPNGTLTINAVGLSFPLLAPDGSAGAPSYSFSGESDMGMFRLAEDFLGFSVNGINRIVIDTSGITGPIGNSGKIVNVGATNTIPSVVAANGDTNTGLGWGGIDILTLVAGGVEIARLIESPGDNQFAIVQSGSSSVPELTSIADLDTGFRWTGGNQLTFIGSGSRAWHFTSARFFSEFSQGPALLNLTAQDDVPTVLADQSDSDTGIGSSGNDELSIIAGGVEGIRVEETAGNVFITYFGPIAVPFGSGSFPGGTFVGDTDTGYFRPVDDAFAITAGGVEAVRYAELSSRIIQTNANHVGLTASVTQTQAGGLALLSSYNEIAIVGTTGDALTAFDVKEGDRLTVINNGANDLQLFPAVGDDIGAGVDAAITIAAGDVGIFLGRDATNWDTLYNAAATPTLSVSFPLLAPDGSAAAPSYSFAADTDIGVFRVGADILGLSARGVTIAQAVGSPGADQFVVTPGAVQNNVAAPDLGFGDGDTGVMQTVDDTIALVAGTILAVRYAETSFGIVQVNASGTGLVASVTQTQVGGLPLISSYNEIATVANSGDALTAFPVLEGSRLTIVNNGANDLQLFPAVGDDFGAGVDTAITIIAGEIGIFLGRDSTNWDTLYNAASTPSFAVPDPLLLSLGSAAAPTYSFSADSDTGMFGFGGNALLFAAAGVAQFIVTPGSFSGVVASAPILRNLAASATVPNIVISSGDVDTGLGTAGANLLSLIAGGSEVMRLSTGGSQINSQLVVTGSIQIQLAGGAEINNEASSATNPTVIPNRADSDTGIGGVAGELSLISNGVEGIRLSTVSSHTVQKNENHVALVASVTQTQGGGLALLSSYNEIATVANEGDALTAFGVDAGERLIVINNGVNGLQLFPAVGDDFGAGVNASITIGPNSTGVFIGRDATNWDVLQNQTATGSVFQGLGTWRYRTEITSPPATGQVRFNNADPTLATEMFLHETNDNGTDVNNFLNLLTAGSIFYIQDRSTSANFFIVEISTNVDNGTDRTFGIANITLEGLEPSQNTEVIIVAIEAGPTPTANDAAQARRTTDYTITTAFADVTLDTTDVETDSAVLDHDLVTNTDNIIIGVTGTYEITYGADIDPQASGANNIRAFGRVRINDAGVDIPGSLASVSSFEDTSVDGDFVFGRLQCSFIVNLTATDFVTLQLMKVEIDGSGTFTAEEVTVTAKRLL